MSVMVNTSLGDLVIDLHIEDCPLACKNFLKLCKIKYYNNCLFHTVQKDFIVQTGDPTGTGEGGDSIYKFLYGDQARFFQDEIHVKSKHEKVGTVGMASAGEDLNASQFYITTREELDSLDGKHTIFGEVVEGLDTLQRINDAYVDGKGRPYKNIRIKHTYILEDPFEDPPQLVDLIPESSPLLQPQEGGDVRLEDDWVPMDEQLEPEEVEKTIRKREAHSRAVVLEMIGDIPEAEMKPPENVLFVCKLNPVTQDEDLEIIFSRFGKVISADIIRDYKTGDSLCYGFIEFESQEACEAAYFKMDNVLIDDRRIHVDFSQSVAKLWTRFRRFGTKDEGDKDENQGSKLADKQTYQLKDTGGQRGGTGRRYEMVFDDDVNNGTERRNRLNSQERREKLADEVKRVKEGHEERRFKDRRHEDNGRGDDYKSKEKQRDRKRDSPETKYATKHGDKDSRESRKRNIDEADGIRRDRSEHRYSKSYDDRGYRESRSHSHHNRSRSPRDKASNDRRESYKRAHERERAEAHRR